MEPSRGVSLLVQEPSPSSAATLPTWRAASRDPLTPSATNRPAGEDQQDVALGRRIGASYRRVRERIDRGFGAMRFWGCDASFVMRWISLMDLRNSSDVEAAGEALNR